MKIRPLFFAAVCCLGFLSVSCSDETSSNTPDVQVTPTPTPTPTNNAKAEQEWAQYRSDCALAGPLPNKTFSDGSRGRCVPGVNGRPTAFRNR